LQKDIANAVFEARKVIDMITGAVPSADFAATNRLIKSGHPFLALRATQSAAINALICVIRGRIRDLAREEKRYDSEKSEEIERLFFEAYCLENQVRRMSSEEAYEVVFDYLEELPLRIGTAVPARLLLEETPWIRREISSLGEFSDELTDELEKISQWIRVKIEDPRRGKTIEELRGDLSEFREKIAMIRRIVEGKARATIEADVRRDEKRQKRSTVKMSKRERHEAWRQNFDEEDSYPEKVVALRRSA